MEWLNRIFEKILSLWPSRIILGPHEAGVRMTWIPFFGLHIGTIGNGWYIKWGIIQDILFMEIKTQVVDLRCQSVLTRDLKDVTVSAAIRYYVTDVRKAILEVQDIDSSLIALAIGIIQDYVGNRNLVDCTDREALKQEILKGIRDEAANWGLKIQKIYITDFGRTRNIRLLTNNGNYNYASTT